MPSAREPRVKAIEVSFLIHATEDPDRVVAKVCEALGVGKGCVSVSRLTGHFGNPIRYCSLRLRGSEAKRVLSRILESLSQRDLEILLSSYRDRSDERGRLHIRMDKQAMILGKAGLAESDPVRIRVNGSGIRGLIERYANRSRGSGKE